MPERDDFATELRGDGMRISNDAAGFTLFFQWLMGIASVIAAAALLWVASSLTQLREDVAVIKARPEPVTKEEFRVRMESVEARLSTLEGKRR
jgi:hypothetical protein